MKKNITIILLLVLLIFLLTALMACGKKAKGVITAETDSSGTYNNDTNYSKSKEVVELYLTDICETKIKSTVTMNDGFADDHESPSADKEHDLNIGNAFLLVSLDKEHSGINKDQTLMFVGIDNIEHIEDITHIDGDIDKKKYLNKDEFMQIIKVFLIDCSEEGIIQTAEQIAKIEGVVAVERNEQKVELASSPPLLYVPV